MADLAELLSGSPGALVLLCGIVGLLIGSFLNVVILRLPARLQREWELQSRELLGLDVATAPDLAHAQAASGAGDALPDDQPGSVAPSDLVFSRSRCPKCGHALAPWENIPLLSYVMLRGRCRSCRTAISPQYPLVEALTGLVFALCAWRFGFTPQLLVVLTVSASLIALSVIDAHTQLLPDQITLPLLWFALIASTLGWTIPPPLAILGATIGYLSLWSIYWLFKLATGKEGMGYGDFKLLAALGALTGPAGILPIVLIASMVGAITGAIQLGLQGRDRATPLPFGPYLAAAGLIQILYGSELRSAWNAWFGLG